MVLFDEDIVQQGVTIDTTTKNLSFVKMHTVLKSMGVQNNKFFLALHDRTLIGVDPHNLGKHDTTETRARIATECLINPWYYLREVVRIPEQGAVQGTHYQLNRANLALCWCFFNKIHTFLTMPRQLGKTITVATLMSYVLYISGRNVITAMFTRDTKQRHENVTRIKNIRDSLPKWFVHHQFKDGDNKEGIAYKSHSTEYKTHTAQTDLGSAETQARGETYAFEHWDEFAYYRFNRHAYPAATACCNTAQPQAWAAGLRCANIITTTAGKLSTKHGAYAYEIRSNCARFTEQIYDVKNETELMDILNTNTSGESRMFYLEYNHAQLGKDEAWFARVTANKDVETIALDYCNIWLNTADNPVLTKDISEKLTANRIDPIHLTMSNGLIHKWYVEESTLKSKSFLDRPMVIGMDLSDNVGRDFTTLVMLDPTDMSVVCSIRCNQVNLTWIARATLKLLKQFPHSIIIPERNRSGGTMLDILIAFMVQEGINPFKRIYNRAVQERGEGGKDIDINSESPMHGAVKSKFGFSTGPSSREFLYTTVLPETFRRNYQRVYDQDIIDEVNGLTIRNGRVDHAVSGHDDTLIAYLLAAYLILYGKNLYVYGLKQSDLLSNIAYDGSEVDPEEKLRQTQYYEEKKKLESQLSKTTSDFVKRALQYKLKDIMSRIKEGIIDDEPISVSQAVDPKPDVSLLKTFGKTSHVDALTYTQWSPY